MSCYWSYSTCGQGRWHCTDEPCPGQCQVYGNGHYQTFDSKWYRFNGHCQYTLVEVRSRQTEPGVLPCTYILLLFSFLLSFLKFFRIIVEMKTVRFLSVWRAFPAAMKKWPALGQLFWTFMWFFILFFFPFQIQILLATFFLLNQWLTFLCSTLLQSTVTLTLSDQRVTRRLQTNTTSPMDLLYATRTVGLYIIVSVPSKGITLIWDKHTRITVELQPNWRVSKQDVHQGSPTTFVRGPGVYFGIQSWAGLHGSAVWM